MCTLGRTREDGRAGRDYQKAIAPIDRRSAQSTNDASGHHRAPDHLIVRNFSFDTTSLPVPLNTTSPSCGLSHDSNLARLRHLSFRTHVGLSQASPTTRTQMSVPSTLYRARVSSIGSDTLIRLIEEQAGASEQNLAGP